MKNPLTLSPEGRYQVQFGDNQKAAWRIFVC
jgi:hypothetical protein